MRHSLPIADLQISYQAKRYINQILKTNRLTYGPFTKKFETEFAKINHRKYAVFLNSGSSALLVSLLALKELYSWKDGDEILVPSLTFISSSNAIIHAGLTPVFVDVEEAYYCINPQHIESKITQKTKGIMPVHLFGQSSDMDQIITVAKKHNLRIIEDSCETVFATYKKRPVGSLGDISVFSTYTAHILVTGVGGIITTNNKKLAEIIKSLIFHGRNNSYLTIDDDDTTNTTKLKKLIDKRFEFNRIGHSFRLTELEAALGLAELERKNQIIRQKTHAGKLLNKVFSEFEDFFQLPKVRLDSTHIYMLYPIVIIHKKINRSELLLELEKNGIETRLFFPLLTQPIYKKLFGNTYKNFPVADYLSKNGFIIGANPYLSYQDANHLKEVLRNYLQSKKLL